MSAHVDCHRDATLQQSIASRRPSLAYVSLASLVGALIWLRWGGIRKGTWADLDADIRGAAVVTRHEPLYSVSVHGLLFTYPPIAVVLHRPLELLGEGGAVGH